jgi:ribonuclease-3
MIANVYLLRALECPRASGIKPGGLPASLRDVAASRRILPDGNCINVSNGNARVDDLQERLGIRFRNVALLEQALVHRSLLREQSDDALQSNERLEFLGDAIIGAFVARYLFDELPSAPEGELTILRTWLVRTSTLGKWGAELDLERYLRLGRSDEGSSRRDRLLARTFEAVVGAIYADQGIRGVEKFLKPFVRREFKLHAGGRPMLDAKSRLQQVTQSSFETMPAYQVLSVEGPGHDPIFTIEVRVGSHLQVTAQGRTKQEAEQAAARQALESLEAEHGSTPATNESGTTCS